MIQENAKIKKTLLAAQEEKRVLLGRLYDEEIGNLLETEHLCSEILRGILDHFEFSRCVSPFQNLVHLLHDDVF
jgi:hypothetical protein